MVCGLDSDLVWIIPSVVYYTGVFVLDNFFVDSSSIIFTSMFLLELSLLCEVCIVAFKGSLVTPDRCLFFYQVCEHSQFRWPWLMSIDILLKM